MTIEELRAATRAYQQAEQAVDRAEAALDAAKERRAAAKADLAEQIVKAAKEGIRQVDIVAETKYSREYVRRIVRAAEQDKQQN